MAAEPVLPKGAGRPELLERFGLHTIRTQARIPTYIHMLIHIHIYAYIYLCICICVCTYVYVYICIYILV